MCTEEDRLISWYTAVYRAMSLWPSIGEEGEIIYAPQNHDTHKQRSV